MRRRLKLIGWNFKFAALITSSHFFTNFVCIILVQFPEHVDRPNYLLLEFGNVPEMGISSEDKIASIEVLSSHCSGGPIVCIEVVKGVRSS